MRSFETSGSFNPRTLRHSLSDVTAKTLELAFGNCCPSCSNRFLNVANVIHHVQIAFHCIQIAVHHVLNQHIDANAKRQQTQKFPAPLPIWNRIYSTKTQKDIIKMDVIVPYYKRLSFNINVVRHFKSSLSIRFATRLYDWGILMASNRWASVMLFLTLSLDIQLCNVHLS